MGFCPHQLCPVAQVLLVLPCVAQFFCCCFVSSWCYAGETLLNAA